MATPLYDALVAKVRDWSNKKEVATIPDSVIEDCLKYSADECYRELRIPPLESTVTYTVTAGNNSTDSRITEIEIPFNLTEFIHVRKLPSNSQSSYESEVFSQVSNSISFLDSYTENYAGYSYMWLDGKIKIQPQLSVDDVLEISYYRRLPDLNATYRVIAANYYISSTDEAQPYLELVASGGSNLYFAGTGSTLVVLDSYDAASLYDIGLGNDGSNVTTKQYIGKESSNWLRDSNERLLIWGALYNVGAYLFDEGMESRYARKFKENIDSLNRAEQMRRAKGGVLRTVVSTNGLI
jgi:hypothetical protein